MSKYCVLYTDGGDLNCEVASIKSAVLFKWNGASVDLEECHSAPRHQVEYLVNGTTELFEERYGDVESIRFQPVTEFGTDVEVVSQVVTVSDDGEVNRIQLADGVEGGRTLVLVSNVNEFQLAAHAYFMDGQSDSVLSKLEGLDFSDAEGAKSYLDSNAVKVESWAYDEFNGGYAPEA
ncbi:hypothetical protein [Bacillus phage SPO1L1]|nr:hypothetical protein [Bacillus phage SPO1L1]WIT26149.1 hypothetical protein [Bacillus phage SPO1L2]